MSTQTEQIVADIKARIEATALGIMASGGHCAEVPDSVLHARDIERAAGKLASMSKPLIGITCRPDVVARVRRMANAEKHPLLGPVPVYEKQDQAEPCRAFYEHDELHRYLSPVAG